MDIKTSIIVELKKSSNWTRRLLKDFDLSREFEIPEGSKSNINWQVGHIMLSRHFHSVVASFGKQEELMAAIPFVSYAKLYAMGTQPHEKTNEKPSTQTLLDQMEMIDQTAIALIENMDPADLENEPLRTHPVAKNIYDALMWSSQHQMWHNGQIAALKGLMKTDS